MALYGIEKYDYLDQQRALKPIIAFDPGHLTTFVGYDTDGNTHFVHLDTLDSESVDEFVLWVVQNFQAVLTGNVIADQHARALYQLHHFCPHFLVDEYLTTKRCSACQNLNYPGASRVYECQYCGWRAHRDVNAARNILERGLRELGGGDGASDGARTCGLPDTGAFARFLAPSLDGGRENSSFDAAREREATEAVWLSNCGI